MGIISSKLTPVAVRLAWICQMLLDPRYSCTESIENGDNKIRGPAQEIETKPQHHHYHHHHHHHQQALAGAKSQSELSSLPVTPEPVVVAAKSSSPPTLQANKLPENNNSLHQENRNRRAMQLRFKTRPSSFDAALIVRGKTKNSVIVTSTSSPLRRQNISPLKRQNRRVWDVSSSSGCSSDTGSNSDSDSETELRVSENVSNEEGSTKLVMSAEEEEAFRLTVGRGHFSRSKKDRFLNNLRLEKRLNDLNNDHFSLPCKNHRRILQRRHSGDLHQLV